ncbi:TRAP transporter small permease [Bacillus sp. H-16]|uniref:TRAP transporter small permease n=1 Tax=Alteribacter salitolerans TaxID=2912333 RepID=UPI001962891A|nr:TRAP transporter small permease [Alteribacter salitolerans]MBM7095334.1 TRAP transporter small permease [Alteribacter salitolerans]
MNTLSAGIAKFEKGLAIVLIFFMAVFMTTSVLFRYFLNAPLSWVGEISIFLLIWITFIGGSLGLKYKSQASVTILLDNVPFLVKKVLHIIGHLIMISFLLLMLYYSMKWITSSGVSYQRANSVNIPMWIPYTVVPLGFACAFVHITANLTTIVKEGEAK